MGQGFACAIRDRDMLVKAIVRWQFIVDTPAGRRPSSIPR